jgi:Leucine-rich repeat (LRR) protein
MTATAQAPRVKLDLRAEGFAALPEDVEEIRELYVCECGLADVPPSIGRLRNLRVLDIAHNALRTVPDEIGRLRALDVLYLADNQLTLVPAGVLELRTLRYLGLDANRLTELPDAVGELSALVEMRPGEATADGGSAPRCTGILAPRWCMFAPSDRPPLRPEDG